MTNDNTEDKNGLSRRKIFGAMAGAAAAVPLVTGSAQAQGRGGAAANNGPLAATGAGAPIDSQAIVGNQGGSGPIRVLFISSYHPFDRENLFRMLDRFGTDITWCHVEHPAAEKFFDPAIAEDFDVFLFYDAFAGRKRRVPGAPPLVGDDQYAVPSPKLQADLKRLLTNGDKGFVMFHHALASWCHTWPAGVNGSNAYVEMMGGAADWGLELKNLRGVTYPRSGYRQGTEQRVTVVDKSHPVTAGVDDYDIVDETYLCPMFENTVHPLLRTSFKPTADKFAHAPNGSNVGAGHPPGSDMVGWYKAAENTPLVYIQHGHDNNAWSNPHFQRLMLNAIKWVASPEGKAWAKANPQRIFR